MKCCRCPLYHYWSNESDRGESCAIFGDGWDSPFQYDDKEGTIVGCYLDRHYIEKADAERDEYYASMAESMARQLKVEADTPQTETCEGCRFESGPFCTVDGDCKYYDRYEPKDEPQIGEMMTEEEFDSMLARVLIGKDEPQTERSSK